MPPKNKTYPKPKQPIMIYPDLELREKINLRAEREKRSMNFLIIEILKREFK